eukprot:6573607-Alexandrium_andersonii.AAC.1
MREHLRQLAWSVRQDPAERFSGVAHGSPRSLPLIFRDEVVYHSDHSCCPRLGWGSAVGSQSLSELVTATLCPVQEQGLQDVSWDAM